MRDQSDPLVSVLRTFVYDPLVEWSKPAKGRSNLTESGEIKNEKVNHEADIKRAQEPRCTTFILHLAVRELVEYWSKHTPSHFAWDF